MSAALAIQAVGGAMVPIYANSTPDQAAYVIKHSDAKFVFVDTPALLGKLFEAWDDLGGVLKVVLFDDALDAAAVLKELKSDGKDVPNYSDVEQRLVTWSNSQAIGGEVDAERDGEFERLMDAVSLDQTGVMLYTSGTTGRPKGVPLTHRNVAVNGRDWLQCNAPLVDENAVDVLWLPMSHIFGFGEACLGNTLGFTSYMADPLTALSKLPEVKPSVFMSVPRYFEKIAQAAMTEPDGERRAKKLAEITGGNLKFCLSGGAGLKREVKDFFYEHGILIIEGYGLTEASPTLTLNRPGDFRFDSVGKPLPSVEIRLAEDGEILARGESIFGGYHKNPQATQETFTDDGWLKTGDLGRWTDDGFLQIIGRKKEILVTAGGKNIAPGNIEEKFVDDPYIAQVVAYGDGEKYLVGGVWLNWSAVRSKLGDDADNAEAVQAFVQQRVDRVNTELPSYQTLKKVHIFDGELTVENGFLTPTLKLKRKKVYETFGEQLDALY
jgi:long-chain acyl-CoA synthetase